jgi:PleD family two-component response regulator
MPESRVVVAVLNDLMFTVKIQEAARRAGVEAVFVKTRSEVMDRAEENPSAIILDLNYTAVTPLELISALKGNEKTRNIPLLGYVAHVQVEIKQAALRNGCNMVVARSAFVQNLPEFLERVSRANPEIALNESRE